MGRTFDRVFRANRTLSNGKLEKQAADLAETEGRLARIKRENAEDEREREKTAANAVIGQEHKTKRPGGKPDPIEVVEPAPQAEKPQGKKNRMSKAMGALKGQAARHKQFEEYSGIRSKFWEKDDDDEPER